MRPTDVLTLSSASTAIMGIVSLDGSEAPRTAVPF